MPNKPNEPTPGSYDRNMGEEARKEIFADKERQAGDEGTADERGREYSGPSSSGGMTKGSNPQSSNEAGKG